MYRSQISQGSDMLDSGVNNVSSRMLTDLFQGLINTNSSIGGSKAQTMAAADQIPCYDGSSNEAMFNLQSQSQTQNSGTY